MEFDRENLSVARLGRQLLFHCFDVLRFLTSLAFGAPMLVPKLGKAVSQRGITVTDETIRQLICCPRARTLASRSPNRHPPEI